MILTKVGIEEIIEWGNLRLGNSVIGVLSWEGRNKEDRSGNHKSLHIWMEELSSWEDSTTLEGMTSNHGGMCVIYIAITQKNIFIKKKHGVKTWRKGSNLQATHLRVLNHERVWENLFLIFLGLSAPL
jgi:hypothetical protein